MNQIWILVIDKFVIAAIILLLDYFQTKRIEKYKNRLIIANNANDLRYEKISLIIDKMWDCSLAFEKMISYMQKKDGTGCFDDCSDLLKADPCLKEKYKTEFLVSIDEFGKAIIALSSLVDRSKFWLGDDLYSYATKIYSFFNDYIWALKSQHPQNVTNISKKINERRDYIHAFEELASTKLQQSV